MIRRNSVLIAVLALVLTAPLAHAAAGDWSITLNGGIGVPISKLSDVPTTANLQATPAAKITGLGTKAGFSGGVGVDYMVTEAVAIGANGSFSKADGKDELNTNLKTAYSYTAATATGSMIEGGVHLKYFLPIQDSPMSPYLMGGAGFYSFKSKLEFAPTPSGGLTSPVEATSNKLGGKLGLGFTYKAAEKVGLGLEGMFNFFSFDNKELAKKLTPTGGTAPTVDVTSASNFAVRAIVSFNMASQ